jgi:hypothetical protein
MIVTDVLLMGWIGMGIFLANRSDLRTCSHDSLWVMSIIFLVIIVTWILVQIVYAVVKIANYICVTQEIQYQQLWTTPTTPQPTTLLQQQSDQTVSNLFRTSQATSDGPGLLYAASSDFSNNYNRSHE